jgi:drug/metabolite transporter (DMT)-like permease
MASHLALAGAQLAFGLQPVIGVFAIAPGGVAPLAVAAWRIAGATAALAVITRFRRHRRLLPARHDLPAVLAASLLGVAIPQGLFFLGLSGSTPMRVGLVVSLIPVFTFAIATIVRLEPWDWLRALGIGIALAGAVPLVFEHGLGSPGAYGAGNLRILGAAAAYSGFLVVSKPLTRRYAPILILTWAFGFSLATLPVLTIGQTVVPRAAGAWWALAYVVVFPTVVAYLLTMYALSRLRASTAGVYAYGQPLVTALASWIAFGERPTVAMGIAAPALFVGIWLVGRRPPGAEEPPGGR